MEPKKSTNNKIFLLPLCILLDGIGMLSYLVPGLTEWVDIFWAPLAATIYWIMFGGKKGFVGSVLVFIEEGLPITDAIPSFTLTWLIRNQTTSEKNLQPLTER